MRPVLFELSDTDTEALQELLDSVTSLNARQWLFALGLLLMLLIASYFLTKLFIKRLSKSQRISKSLHTVLVTLVRFMLVMLSIMVSANAVGISFSAFMVIFSLVGAAVALAAQGVLNNIAGCIILLNGRLFEVGDYIETADCAGTVQEINLLNTKLLSYEGHTIYIPNSILYTTTVTNLTAFQKRRTAITFRIPAKHSPADVRAAVEDAAAEIPQILPDPHWLLVVSGYTAGHINYTLLAWATADDYWTMRNGLNEQLYTAFAQHGIEMVDKDISFVVSDS